MAKNNNIWKVIAASLFLMVGICVLTNSVHATSADSPTPTGIQEATVIQNITCEPVKAGEMNAIVNGVTLDPLNPGENGVAEFEKQLIDVFDEDPKKPKGTAFYYNILEWAYNKNMTPQKHQYLRYTLNQLEILLKKRSVFNFQDVYDQYLKGTNNTDEKDVNGVTFKQGWIDFYDDTLKNQDARDLGKLRSLLNVIRENRSDPTDSLLIQDIEVIIVELETLESALQKSPCEGSGSLADPRDRIVSNPTILDTIPCEDFTQDEMANFSKDSPPTEDVKNMMLMITKVQEIINPARAVDMKGSLERANKGDKQLRLIAEQRRIASRKFDDALNVDPTQQIQWRKGGEDEDSATLLSSMIDAFANEQDPTRKAALQAIVDKFKNQTVDTCEAPAVLPDPQPISCNALSAVEKKGIIEIEGLDREPSVTADKMSNMSDPAKSVLGRLVAGTSTPADNQFLRVRYFHQRLLGLFNDGGGRKPAQIDPVDSVQPRTINFTDSLRESGETTEPAVIPIRESSASDAATQQLFQLDPSDPGFNAALIGGLRAFITASAASGELSADRVTEYQNKMTQVSTFLNSIQLANCGGGTTPPTGTPPTGTLIPPTAVPPTAAPTAAPPTAAPTAAPPTAAPTAAPKPAVTTPKPAPKPTVTKPTPKPAPKPTVTKPAPKPVAKPAVTKPAPKPVAKPAAKPAVAASSCPMLSREEIFRALSTTVAATRAPEVGSPESAYAAFDKKVNLPYNRNNSYAGRTGYDLLKRAARGIPLTPAENKALSKNLKRCL